MQARVYTFQPKVEQVNEDAAVFHEAFQRDVRGFVDALLLVDRQGEKAMTITLWEDGQARDDSAQAAAEVTRQAADMIDGQPERHNYGVVEHRPGQNRRYARVSTGSAKPSWFDQRVHQSMIDAASQQPGYAGFLVLADRDNNQVIGVSLWDSKECLEASETGYYAREMEKSRNQLEGGRWERDVFEVLAQRK